MIVAVAILLTASTTEPSSTTMITPLFSLPGHLQCVLQTTAPSQDEVVLRIVVALAHHLHLAKPDGALHVGLALPLDLPSIPASVVTLDHTRLPALTSSTATNTAQLGHRGAPPACGHLSCSQRQHLYISQSDLLILLSPA